MATLATVQCGAASPCKHDGLVPTVFLRISHEGRRHQEGYDTRFTGINYSSNREIGRANHNLSE